MNGGMSRGGRFTRVALEMDVARNSKFSMIVPE